MKLLLIFVNFFFLWGNSAFSQLQGKVNFMGGILRNSPDFNSSEILTIKSGGNITILEYSEKPYFKVSYNDTIGYLSYSSIEKNSKLDEMIAHSIVGTNPRMANLIMVYGAEMAEQIMSGKLNGKYWIGMDDYLAIELLGFPDKKNVSVGEWGQDEQWIYRSKNIYLYFSNGKLKSYQK